MGVHRVVSESALVFRNFPNSGWKLWGSWNRPPVLNRRIEVGGEGFSLTLRGIKKKKERKGVVNYINLLILIKDFSLRLNLIQWNFSCVALLKLF